MNLPWWALSPSPFSVIFYLILIAFGMKHLLKQVPHRRWKHVHSFTESFFFLGFVVLLGDTQWMIASLLRFGGMFPQDIVQGVLLVARDLVGLLLCFLSVGSYLHFRKASILVVIVNMVFLGLWFGLAESPALTDWTWALSHDYPLNEVLASFLISHVVGKSIVTLLWKTLW